MHSRRWPWKWELTRRRKKSKQTRLRIGSCIVEFLWIAMKSLYADWFSSCACVSFLLNSNMHDKFAPHQGFQIFEAKAITDEVPMNFYDIAHPKKRHSYHACVYCVIDVKCDAWFITAVSCSLDLTSWWGWLTDWNRKTTKSFCSSISSAIVAYFPVQVLQVESSASGRSW